MPIQLTRQECATLMHALVLYREEVQEKGVQQVFDTDIDCFHPSMGPSIDPMSDEEAEVLARRIEGVLIEQS